MRQPGVTANGNFLTTVNEPIPSHGTDLIPYKQRQNSLALESACHSLLKNRNVTNAIVNDRENV